MIFIYRRDKYRKGLPVYHIDRFVKETGKDFGDGSHIIYVNGRYEGDDEIGRLLHDFKSRKSVEIYNRELARGVWQYKETEEGRAEMADIVKEYGKIKEREGEKRGETLLGKLILVLQKAERYDDITRVASDSKYRQKLYKELNISL